MSEESQRRFLMAFADDFDRASQNTDECTTFIIAKHKLFMWYYCIFRWLEFRLGKDDGGAVLPPN